MSKYNAFHVRYEQGQRQMLVGAPGLVEHLESYGGGLPPDPVWRVGGPLLIVGPDKRTHILAWMRSLPFKEVGRENAWEAWGVIGPIGGFGNWTSFWDALTSEPEHERLESLAAAFAHGGRGAGYPPIPQRLASVLADVYSSDDASRRIALSAPSEIPLLPWCCLVGPVRAADATVGPPRRMQVKLSSPLTYDPSIIDVPLTAPREIKLAKSALLKELVSCAQESDIDGAMMIAMSLRDLPPAERRKRIFAPPAFANQELAPPPAPQRTVQQPSAHVAQRPFFSQVQRPRKSSSLARLLRRWALTLTLPALAAMIVLHVMEFMAFSRLADAIEESRVPVVPHKRPTDLTDTTGTATATSAALAATSFECAKWWTDQTTRDQVLTAAQQKLTALNLTLSGEAVPLVTQKIWDANGEAIATSLAVQLQIDMVGCGSVGLDGNAGAGTRRAVDLCTRTGHPIKQGPKALQWLCGWASPQS